MEPPSTPARALAVMQWLAAEAPALTFTGRMLDGFAALLQAAGLPVARMTLHVQLLNPQVSRIMREWRRGRGTVESTRPHGIENTPSYVGSPVQYVVERRDWLVRRLDAAAAREFPLLAELRAEGLTHYALAPLFFSDGAINAASWASDAPEGFDDAQLALLRAVTPVLTLLVEMAAVRRMGNELLATYLGRSTAGRVLAGEIQRGHMQRIEAAILVCDLRGFTRFSNSHDEAEVIDALNRYFDAVGTPVQAYGGEILKFQGDGLMAIFRDTVETDAGSACRRAIAAAVDAVAAFRGPAGASALPLDIGIALHHGTVAYGNIGTRDRLDFTVVGHDVNLAYRIERQCAALCERILMSARVAQASALPARSLGTFALRGFEAQQELFAPIDSPKIDARTEV